MAKILRFDVELLGNHDVSLNGADILNNGKHLFEEKVFLKRFSLKQQWALICEVRQLLRKLEYSHKQRLVHEGKLPEAELNTKARAERVRRTTIEQGSAMDELIQRTKRS